MEYEYSFEVESLKKYINYCKTNGYKLTLNNHQIRTIYRNKPNIARITINDNNGDIIKKLDFKEDKLSDDILIIRKESKEIEFDDISNCEDILDFLGYKKDNTLDRIRTVYEKEDIKFEFDEYLLPKKTYVVAIEGNKTKVDKIYNELTL